MHTSKSLFQMFSYCVLLCVSLAILWYFFQYSMTITRFQEFHQFCSHNDTETCLSFDLLFLFEIAVIGISAIFVGLLLKSFIVYLEESNSKNLPIFCWRMADCVDFPVPARIALLLFFFLLIGRLIQGFELHGLMEYPVLVLGLAGFACFIQMCFPYDDVDVSCSVNLKNSIGAAYAYGACNSYYNVVLKNFNTRAKEWEEKNGRDLSLKKLVVICPLSCNVDGNIKQRCESNIDIISEFTSDIVDQGANMNRNYKHTIYGIESSQNVTLVAAEFASPLGVLHNLKNEQRLTNIETQKFDFIRDCCIYTLKEHLQSKGCLVVEYDDINPSKSLDIFLLSVVEQDSRKIYKVKEV